MKRVLGSLLLLILPHLSSCRTTSGSNPRRFADRVSEKPLPKDLIDANFPATKDMNKDYFRRAYSDLSEEAFASLWTASLENPLRFFQSHRKIWTDEVSRLPAPGAIGPCVGDAHPGAFAYRMHEADGYRYEFTETMQAEPCPVPFDALRYFVQLNMETADTALVDEIRKAYIQALKGNESSDFVLKNRTPNAGESLVPLDWKALPREQMLAVLAYQVSLVGRVHRVSISKPETYGSWLSAQIPFMTKRWNAAYELNKQ